VTEERTAFGRVLNGRSVAWQRGKKGGRQGGPERSATRRGGGRGAWPRPAGGAWQRPERGERGRRAPRTHCRSETETGKLTGGPRHSVGRRCR
jgi:hypothetical protein